LKRPVRPRPKPYRRLAIVWTPVGVLQQIDRKTSADAGLWLSLSFISETPVKDRIRLPRNA
jgi:hypothetical protein